MNISFKKIIFIKYFNRVFQKGNSYYESNVKHTPKNLANKSTDNDKKKNQVPNDDDVNFDKRQESYMNRWYLHQAVSDLPEGYG